MRKEDANEMDIGSRRQMKVMHTESKERKEQRNT